MFISSNVVDKIRSRPLADLPTILYGLTKLYGESILVKVSRSVTIFRLTGIIGPRAGRCFFNQILWKIYRGQDVSVVESGFPFSEFCVRHTVSKSISSIDFSNEGISLRGGYAPGNLLLTDLLNEAKKLIGSSSRLFISRASKTSTPLPRRGHYKKELEYLPDTQLDMLRFAISDHICPVDFIAKSIGYWWADFLLSVRHLQPVDLA